jgi:hypothetical protein
MMDGQGRLEVGSLTSSQSSAGAKRIPPPLPQCAKLVPPSGAATSSGRRNAKSETDVRVLQSAKLDEVDKENEPNPEHRRQDMDEAQQDRDEPTRIYRSDQDANGKSQRREDEAGNDGSGRIIKHVDAPLPRRENLVEPTDASERAQPFAVRTDHERKFK